MYVKNHPRHAHVHIPYMCVCIYIDICNASLALNISRKKCRNLHI